MWISLCLRFLECNSVLECVSFSSEVFSHYFSTLTALPSFSSSRTLIKQMSVLLSQSHRFLVPCHFFYSIFLLFILDNSFSIFLLPSQVPFSIPSDLLLILSVELLLFFSIFHFLKFPFGSWYLIFLCWVLYFFNLFQTFLIIHWNIFCNSYFKIFVR